MLQLGDKLFSCDWDEYAKGWVTTYIGVVYELYTWKPDEEFAKVWVGDGKIYHYRRLIDEDCDFTHHFKVERLQPATPSENQSGHVSHTAR